MKLCRLYANPECSAMPVPATHRVRSSTDSVSTIGEVQISLCGASQAVVSDLPLFLISISKGFQYARNQNLPPHSCNCFAMNTYTKNMGGVHFNRKSLTPETDFSF